jgi:hypothetical protein
LTAVFAENLDAFLDVASGFAVTAALDGDSVSVIFDAPGVEVLDGAAAITEPSVLLKASVAIAGGQSLVLAAEDLPAQLAHLAGTYRVRVVLPDAPDGAFVRATLAKA